MRWFLLLLLCTPAWAWTDYYVSSSGVAAYASATSPGTPCSLETAVTDASGGDRVNIKADGTYNISSDLATGSSGSGTSPIWFRGYSTTIGDGGRPTLDRGTGYYAVFDNTTNDFIIYDTLIMVAETNYHVIRMGDASILTNCIVTNTRTSTSGFAIDVNNGCVVVNNYITCLVSNTGVIDTAPSVIIQGNTIVAGNNGIYSNYTINGGVTISNNVIICDGSGSGINITSYADSMYPLVITGNTIVNCVNGIYLNAGPDSNIDAIYIANNLIWNCSAYGINNNEAATNYSFLVLGNAIGSVTSGEYNLGNGYYSGIALGSNDPFVDSAGGDYTIDPDSTGGAMLSYSPTDMDLDGTQDHWGMEGMLHPAPSGGGSTVIIIED